MNVKYVNWGILTDPQGNAYTDDGQGQGNVMSLSTGEIFKITNRDENGMPCNIENLYEYEKNASFANPL